MPDATVIFYDSGLGGLSHVPDFLALVSCTRLVYFSDSANFPYGTLSTASLESMIVANVGALIGRHDPCMVVVACNTASVAALAALRKAYPSVIFVGTVPAIKLAAEHSRTGHIGVIATERTVNDSYIHDLAARHAPSCVLETIAASELVEFVENRYLVSSREEREQVVRPLVEQCLARECDVLVLACTHFIFLADEFKRLAQGRARVFDSRDGVARRAASLYTEHCSPSPATPVSRLYLESTVEGAQASLDESRRAFIASTGFDCMERVPAFSLARTRTLEALPAGVSL